MYLQIFAAKGADKAGLRLDRKNCWTERNKHVTFGPIGIMAYIYRDLTGTIRIVE
jgi:hypothetical protein